MKLVRFTAQHTRKGQRRNADLLSYAFSLQVPGYGAEPTVSAKVHHLQTQNEVIASEFSSHTVEKFTLFLSLFGA